MMITKEKAIVLATKAIVAEGFANEINVGNPKADRVDSTAKDFWSVEFSYLGKENIEKAEMFGHTALWVKVDAETGAAKVVGPC